MGYEAAMRDRNATRADLIEDLLTGGADTEKGVRAAIQRIKALRKH